MYFDLKTRFLNTLRLDLQKIWVNINDFHLFDWLAFCCISSFVYFVPVLIHKKLICIDQSFVVVLLFAARLYSCVCVF